MNNIFENAYFGKPYKTRDGTKVIYHRYDSLNNRHCLIHEGFSQDIKYMPYGICSLEYQFKTPRGNLYFKCDIVSEWRTEEINEEELDRLAEEFRNTLCEDMDVKWVYKAGYRKALNS